MILINIVNCTILYMPSSHTNPQLIEVDFATIKRGKVDILVHWNITELLDENNNTIYTYNECRMNWILPTPMTNKVDIQNYFDSNYNQGEKILEWAQASKIQESDIT